ncbi:small integral membrane protein 14 [Aricia agestis]|uniref:small integral membrane protein 14 n=1 Tax=Aricia agestis TaxID=91739 RepID=UPI001C206640|nr:small integral membrane protein 14 [Aricia agestis]
MGDEMDPCECLWNHELAMRRLISLLRQGQSYCTDNECLETLPGPQGSAGNSFLVVFMMMALAAAMYVMRPRRDRLQDAAKPTTNSHDNDGAPPTPPRI